MPDSKMKQDLIKMLTDAYNGADGLFNFPDDMDKTVKENMIPWISEQVETFIQNYSKEG